MFLVRAAIPIGIADRRVRVRISLGRVWGPRSGKRSYSCIYIYQYHVSDTRGTCTHKNVDALCYHIYYPTAHGSKGIPIHVYRPLLSVSPHVVVQLSSLGVCPLLQLRAASVAPLAPLALARRAIRE